MMRKLLIVIVAGFAVAAFGCATPENANESGNANRAAATNANGNGSAGREDGNHSDSWITTKAKLALIADSRTSGFATDVVTQNQSVTLSGKVDTNDARDAAEGVVKGIEGVKSVNNQLQVVPEEKRREVNAKDEKINDDIEKALDSDPDLQDLSLSVDSNAGVVTLRGTVDNEEQLLKAAQALRKIPGVKSVVTTGVLIAGEKKS
ncbi:MAG TPA: BON domain-containing protein [Blastocatellia bacterium]|jgi:osmotically-inducible protein OsmY|nr:BON domain-containing protein [Blastocatellia bacterium]